MLLFTSYIFVFLVIANVYSDHGSWSGNWGGNCYMNSGAWYTYTEAVAYCQARNGQVMKIISASENSWVAAFAGSRLQKNDLYWVQYSDATNEGSWVDWLGNAMTYSNWNSGEPNNAGDEDCTSMNRHDGRWNDIACNAGSHYAMCKKPTTSCSIGYCLNGAGCTTTGTTCSGTINCICTTGYQGMRCESEIDECWPNPCYNGGACTDYVGYYTCSCQAGFVGSVCQTNYNECGSSPCVHGNCVDAVNSYSCTCTSGYEDTHCTTEIDECLSAPCQNGGACTNLINAYSCSCVAGYIGASCQTNFDECASNPCQFGGQCTDLVNGFVCTCASGYTDTVCSTDMDECASAPCVNDGTCNNLVGLYTCTCPSAFTDTNCDQDVDECVSDPCQNGAACNNLLDHYTCTCVPGYSGYDCEEDINECISAPCQHNGTCTNLINMFTCTCEVGWTDTVCNTDIDECISAPCGIWGACTDHIAGYSCVCIAGISGIECDIDIDECASGGCSIEDGNATCTDYINGYNCTCGPDYTDTYCDMTMVTFLIMTGFTEEGGALSELAETNDVVAQTATLGDSAPFIVATMDVPDRPPMSWNHTDMIGFCSYEGISCKKNDIIRTTDPVAGNCFTFNDGESMSYKTKRAGQGQGRIHQGIHLIYFKKAPITFEGLLWYLLAGQDQYTPWCDTAGVRVYVRNQSESVYVESVGHVITPGWKTYIGLKWKEYNRMGPPHGECVHDPTEVASYYYPGSFSNEGCVRSCYQDEVYKDCECMDPRFPSDKTKRVCGLNDRKCVNNFVNTKGDPKMWTDCHCPLACLSGEFDIQISRTRYKAVPLKCQHLAKNESQSCIESQLTNEMILEVYFEQFIFVVYNEVPRYTFEQLLSDVGGQLGIIAGISIFSIAEIMFTLVQLIVVLLTNQM